MRAFPPFVGFVRAIGLGTAALACSLLVDLHPLRAEPSAGGAVYAFAQQKIYGMTMTTTPGSSATLVGDPNGFAVKMSTKATVDTIPGITAHNGGLDALQSFIGSGTPLQPVENYSGNVSPGMSVPANERVLLQLNPTAPGTAGGFDTTNPVAGNFIAGHNFARSDSYVTNNPDQAVGPPGSGTVPANAPPGTWPPDGTTVAISKLFAPIGTPGTLSIDLVAEALLTDLEHGTISAGIADWVVTGKFRLTGDSLSRAAISLDFNITERLAVYSYEPLINIATASNGFTMDVLNSAGRSVFGPFLGANPSITRLLSSPATGSETYNNNTAIPTHVYPGPVIVNFQTIPLAPGDYTFTIKGTTTAYVSAVPEPSTHASLALAAACGAAGWWRRRRLRA
jgi:hypothetical protein